MICKEFDRNEVQDIAVLVWGLMGCAKAWNEPIVSSQAPKFTNSDSDSDISRLVTVTLGRRGTRSSSNLPPILTLYPTLCLHLQSLRRRPNTKEARGAYKNTNFSGIRTAWTCKKGASFCLKRLCQRKLTATTSLRTTTSPWMNLNALLLTGCASSPRLNLLSSGIDPMTNWNLSWNNIPTNTFPSTHLSLLVANSSILRDERIISAISFFAWLSVARRWTLECWCPSTHCNYIGMSCEGGLWRRKLHFSVYDTKNSTGRNRGLFWNRGTLAWRWYVIMLKL